MNPMAQTQRIDLPTRLEMAADRLQIIRERRKNGYQTIAVDKGFAKTKGLIKEPTIRVARTWMEKGTEFGNHSHDTVEVISVASGQVAIVFADETHILKEGQSLIIQPGIDHSAVALEDTWLTVSGHGLTDNDQDYPDVLE